jgi:hypothetical protein
MQQFKLISAAVTFMLLLTGCISQVKVNNIQASTDFELCGNFKRFTAINIYQSARKEEIERRGLDCDSEQFAAAEGVAQAKADKARKERIKAAPSFVLKFPKIERPVTRSLTFDGHGLKGWTLVYSGKVTGYVEDDDFDKLKSYVFEGCDYDRAIILDSQYQVVCGEYSYSYHYNPQAIVVAKGGELRLIVEGKVYKVRRY